jgi:DNA invertase Pin-like site-specific DNA recombinase
MLKTFVSALYGQREIMTDRRFVAYYRVSTARQGQSGLGLEAQQSSVLSFVGDNADLIEEFVEIESGKKADRPKLLAALASCKRHGAKLIIAKLDRLARNVAFVSALMEAGIEFVAVDNPHASKLTIHILCAVAEHEREMISERTKAALAAAKARGVRLGNPNGNPRHMADARAIMQENAVDRASMIQPVILEIQRAGLTSYRQIAKALNARGISTARGGRWHPASVRNVILKMPA